MQLKHVARLTLAALLLAWCADQLFWGKAPGLSFFLFVLLCLITGFALTWGEKLRPAWTGLLLLAPALFFSAMTFLRTEPFTAFVNYALALGSMLVLAVTWLGGRWWQYGLADYLLQTLRLGGDCLIKPPGMIERTFVEPMPGEEQAVGEEGAPTDKPSSKPSRIRLLLSILFGLALALPVVVVLGKLLAEADPIFAERMRSLLEYLQLEKLSEYIIRSIYIAILAYLLIGMYVHALLSSQREKLAGVEKPWLPPFLGWLEAAIVLGSVDLLFAFFVSVQFQYFFGGQANIHLEGYTYSEYARKGFGELVAVATLSLMLFVALSAVTRRQDSRQRWIYSGLGIALVGLVAVILVSAYHRLVLYEGAYGFTRLRTYTHVFMAWVGVLLAATALLEATGRFRRFALALALVGVGFGLTLDAIDVDGFIVRQNVARAVQGEALDTAYLGSLSDDAASALFTGFWSADAPERVRYQVGAALACRYALAKDERREERPWQSYLWPRERAWQLYQANQADLKGYSLWKEYESWYVRVDGEKRPCRSWGMD